MVSDEDITLGTILQHMRGMESRLTKKIDDGDARLGKRMDGLEHKMSALEIQMSNLGTRMSNLEMNLTAKIDAIDQRLDEIEIELLPRRVTRLEKAVFGRRYYRAGR